MRRWPRTAPPRAPSVARSSATQAGEIYQRLGDHHGRAGVLAYLGDAQRRAGRNREAGQTLEAALLLFRDQADALEGIAASHRAQGHAGAARRQYAKALAAYAVSYTHLRAHETRHDLVCR